VGLAALLDAGSPAGAAEVSLGGIGLRLGAVFVLVLLNGFFVAAEFALVAARRSRIDQMVAEGDAKARTVQHAQHELDRYISGTSSASPRLARPGLDRRAGTRLARRPRHRRRGFGPRAAPGLVSVAAHSGAAIAVAFAIITFLHIVLGELAPKSLALSRPEAVSRQIARPLDVVLAARRALHRGAQRIAQPPASALIGMRPVGEGEHVHSP
jgi:CBS domain containing-hemolysin-like protein